MIFAKRPRGRTCESCVYFNQEWDGECFEIYCGDYCLKPGQEHFSNLKSFPFAKLMPCFEADFWHTEFAEQFSGEGELLDSPAFKAYLAKYNRPGIPIPQLSENNIGHRSTE